MLAKRSFGSLAAALVAMLAITACAPIVRREGPKGGSGGSATGGTSESGGEGGTDDTGGTTETGGTDETGGTTETGGTDDTGGTTETGGTAGLGGDTGAGGAAGAGGTIVPLGLGGTTSTVCGVASTYSWASTQSIMDPVGDGTHTGLVGIKAPTVVRYQDRYHLFATVADATGKVGMQYASFADWVDAASATVDFLDYNSAFTDERSQPQVFYSTAKKTWFLISQASGPFYSTNTDIAQTRDWSKPTPFYSSTPTIVTQNAGAGGIGWTDFWVICDSTTCHMFFTNTLGYVFRSQTSLGDFPNGFGEPVRAMPQSSYLREGIRVYKVKGGNTYLMTIEGYGSGGRYIGVWTATELDGTWTALAETEANPYAGAGNSSFVGSKWTRDVSHGELVRDSYDETMTVDNCNMRYLYAGKDPFSTAKAEPYPWRLGLLVRSK